MMMTGVEKKAPEGFKVVAGRCVRNA